MNMEATAVPLACVSVVAGTGSIVESCLATLALLVLLALDLYKARQRKTPWVPAKFLLLNTLSTQLMNICTQHAYAYVRLASFQCLTNEAVMEMASLISEKRSLFVTAKASICIFTAYVLPAVDGYNVEQMLDGSMEGTAVGYCWSNVVGWGIFVVTNVVRSMSEVYFAVVAQQLDTEGKLGQDFAVRLILMNTVFSVSMLFQLLSLATALLASMAVSNMANMRLPTLYESCTLAMAMDESSAETSTYGYVYDHNKSTVVNQKLLRFWLAARTWRPSCVISRSVLTCSAFFFATTCLVMSLVEVGQSISHVNNDPWLLVFVPLQMLFVVCTWAVIAWRWLQAITYNPRLLHGVSAFFRQEDFWLRALRDLRDDPAAFFNKEDSVVIKWVFKAVKVMRLEKLILLLELTQIFIVQFSKLCWLLCEAPPWSTVLRRITLSKKQLKVYCNLHSNDVPPVSEETDISVAEFPTFRDSLLFLPSESAQGVYIANLDFIQSASRELNQAWEHGKKLTHLKSLLRQAPADFEAKAKAYINIREANTAGRSSDKIFAIGQRSGVLTAVSLLTILFDFSQAYIITYGSDARLKFYAEAVHEAWEIMVHIDAVKWGVSAHQVIKAANSVLQGLKNPLRRCWLSRGLPLTNIQTAADVPEALLHLQREAEKVDQKDLDLQREAETVDQKDLEYENGFDSKKWTNVIVAGKMWRLCTRILNSHAVHVESPQELQDFLEELESALASVVQSSVSASLCAFNYRLEDLYGGVIIWEKELWDFCKRTAMALGVLESEKFPCFLSLRNFWGS